MSSTENVRNKLIKKHDLDEVAIWHIRGEDPNCDFGGCHSMPSLGYVKGKYRYVVEYALGLTGFVTWGSGGDITPIDVVDVNDKSMKQLADARERIRRLDDELHNAKEALKRLEGERGGGPDWDTYDNVDRMSGAFSRSEIDDNHEMGR